MIGRLIIMDDITERVELEAQLSQADKLSSIGLLAAGVAHEVNTPLAVISSYTQMLAKQLQSDPQKSGLLEKITRQTFRASEIVNNLLNFSRTSGTEIRRRGREQSDRRHAGVAGASVQGRARSKCRTQLAPKLPPIQGNPGRLQQVFLNLVSERERCNAGRRHLARRYLERRQRQRLRLRHRIGIAPEHIQRIYDPFFTTKTLRVKASLAAPDWASPSPTASFRSMRARFAWKAIPASGTTFTLDFPLSRKTSSRLE